MLGDQKAFGRRFVPRAEDAELSLADRARTDASRLHHEVARSVRDRLRRQQVSQGEFAASIGWGPERLSRALNGAAPMSLEDLLLLVNTSGSNLARAAIAALSAEDEAVANLEFLLAYLTSQQDQVRARIADISRARPST